MKTSMQAIARIKQFEGLKMKAYKPVATEKYYTIGYGHCGPDVGPRMTIEPDEAEWLLRRDLTRFEKYVDALNLTLTQHQFDALVDFAFNLGIWSLKSSTLLKYIRAGRPTADIQQQFRRWVYSGKVLLPGLVKRREWEAQWWATM